MAGFQAVGSENLQLSAAIIGGFAAFSYWQVNTGLKDNIQNEALVMLSPVYELISRDLPEGYDDLYLFVRVQIAAKGVSLFPELVRVHSDLQGLMFVEPEGNILRQEGRPTHLSATLYDSIISGVQTYERIDSETVAVSIPFNFKDKNLGSTVLIFSTDRITGQKRRIIHAALIFFLLFLIIGSLVAVFVARSIAAPIVNLSQKISKGTLSEIDLEMTRKDEIGTLSRGFAKMREAIQKQMSELNSEISNRKRAEKELKNSTKRLAIHLEQTPLGVIEWSLNFEVILWNKAAETIFGYSQEEALGQSGLDLIVPKEVHKLVQPIWDDLISGRGGTRSTNENITKDGKTIICEWYNTTLLDSNGVIIGGASLIQDITEKINFENEREELQEHLRQAQKMEAIGTLAGGIAHDFNNILSAIVGYTDLAREELPSRSPVSAYLNEVMAAGNRAKELTKQILSFSRQSEQERKPIQLHLIVKEALKLLRSSIPTTIEIRQDIDDQSGVVLSDATQVHQVIMNLCTNAYHAMRSRGGVLTVKVHSRSIHFQEDETRLNSFALTPGEYVELVVSDTGAGMDRKTTEKIFDPYFTTKEKGEGTGLGLSVVHGIVKSYGGHISVDSTLGEGTTFRLLFPRLVTDMPSADIDSIRLDPRGNERILLVDDENVLVNMTQMMLTRLGYNATGLTSSRTALDIFQQSPDDYDLIITDMNMPEMNGVELVRKIRNIRPNLPIILCTGFSDLIDERKASMLGIKKFLMKPVLKRDLAMAVRKILDDE